MFYLHIKKGYLKVRNDLKIETHKIALGIQNYENPNLARKPELVPLNQFFFGNHLGNFRNPKL